MAQFVNLTPHDINIYSGNTIEMGPQHIIPPSGNVARISYIEQGGGWIHNVPFHYVEYGRFENPPPAEDGTYYIVSLVAALAIRGRDDILAPFEEVRNDKGTIVGCRSLQKVC